MRRVAGAALGMLAVLAGAAPAAARASATDELQADLVVIEKSARTLTLYMHGRELGAYRVALGKAPVGTKECQGDNRTPEGFYTVAGRKADSDFHRALRLSYPSAHDIARARALGCDPGGDIMIHGLKTDVGPEHLRSDWTRGCVAVTNQEIEEIWARVPDGARVEIRP